MQRLTHSVTIVLGVVIFGVCSAEEPSPATVDHRANGSRADLVYEKPAETPDAGQPIGNGRMGTMANERS